VALQHPDLAAQQLEDGVKRLGLRGASIGGHVNGEDLSLPKYDPFWAKAAELGALVFMHPGGADNIIKDGAWMKGAGDLGNIIGNPLETTVATSHLIFDGVMERHPKLKIVLPHAGGYLAHYWARMDHAYKARSDTRGQMKRKPSSYLEKFYFDTITFDHGMLAHLIARFGADHVLLGTDYPYDMGMERPIEFIEGVKGLSKAEAAAIEGGNAARLLKIDYNAAQRRRS
jgi:aminocarboxymuconate-semialdehyde decarboxylase